MTSHGMVWYISLVRLGQLFGLCCLQVLPTPSLLTFGKEGRERERDKVLLLCTGVINTISASNATHNMIQVDMKKVNFITSPQQDTVQFPMRTVHLLYGTGG